MISRRRGRLLRVGLWLGGLVLGGVTLVPSSASAALPQLKLSPTSFTAHLEIGEPKVGYFDVSNPTSVRSWSVEPGGLETSELPTLGSPNAR